jgi:hypothetical protein
VAKRYCPTHADVHWFTYTDDVMPCFVCQPEAWPQLKELETADPSVAGCIAEMATAGHWPPHPGT